MTEPKPRRLGRGLNALLSPSAGPPVSVKPESGHDTKHDTIKGGPAASPDETLLEIPVGEVAPSPFQPRRRFDEAELDQLAASVARSGVMQPVIVRRQSGGGFELVAGERRWRAAKRAGLATVPALVRDLDDATAAEWALVENLQRTDLNPMERARALQGLLDQFGLTQKDVAERVGIDRSSVANLLRLLELEPELQDLVEGGAISLGHGKALLGAPAPARLGLAERCVRESWSVRRLEREASAGDGGGAAAGSGEASRGDAGSGGDADKPELRDLERRLGEYLGTGVSIRATGDGSRGHLKIKFYSFDHFDDLMSRVGFRGSNE